MTSRIRINFEVGAAEGTPSAKTAEVAEMFGIDAAACGHRVLEDVEVPTEGVTFITGYSGSGKSTLLRCLSKQLELVEPMPVGSLPTHGSVVDMFDGDVARVVHWLARFGLGEPRLLVTTPAHLSEGQKQRLVLARLLWDGPRRIAVDEFLSNLDRVTAAIVAYNVQKICREEGVTAFFATAHDDLAAPLCPDHVVRMDFDGKGTCQVGDGPDTFLSWLDQHLVEEQGSVEDFDALAMYHYRECDDRWIDWDDLVVEVRRVRFYDQTVGVKVFARPFPAALNALPLLKEVNERVLIQERVIVHPAFRGIALNRRMNPVASQAEVVFAQSALGLHFPYNLKAGFRRAEHPAETPSASQSDLQSLVHELASQPINVHDAAQILDVWTRLAEDDRDRVRQSLRDALSNWLCRYIGFLAGLIERHVSDIEMKHLEHLFGMAARDADGESIAKLIESAMPFPMAAFVKELGDDPHA